MGKTLLTLLLEKMNGNLKMGNMVQRLFKITKGKHWLKNYYGKFEHYKDMLVNGLPF
jgi:hypothetical protein